MEESTKWYISSKDRSKFEMKNRVQMKEDIRKSFPRLYNIFLRHERLARNEKL